MSSNTLQVSVLMKKEGPFWVAQCLDYDIAGQGKTIQDAQYQMERALVAHVIVCQTKGIAPLEGLQPAPPEYWTMFGKAMPLRDAPADPFRGASLPVTIKPELRVGG